MRANATVGAAILVGLISARSAIGAAEEALFRMEGVVTEEGTRQPVEGVLVRVLIESEEVPEKRIRTAKTDAAGRYSIPVPVGHAWAFGIQPPPGYISVNSFDSEVFATTAQHPVFCKDFLVRKGVVWNVVVRASEGTLQLPKVYVGCGQQLEKEYFGATCELDENGRGVLTLPNLAGEFALSCGDMEQMLVAPEGMKLRLEEGFRSDRVTRVVKQEDGTTELRDDEGRLAAVWGAAAEAPDGRARLTIEVRLRPRTARGQVVGQVVGPHGEQVGGAKVEVAFASDGGASSMTGFSTITDPSGNFRLTIPQPPAGQSVSLAVTADGYGGIDTRDRKVDFAREPEVDIGTVRLQPAASVPIRVVDSANRPLQGAIVEPYGTYSERARIRRTDEEGMCTLTNLPPGVRAISARFGSLYASAKLPLRPGENELLVLKLAPATALSEAGELKVALGAGAAAPDWEVAEWTDGAMRKLADYRGKVVVLDFWGAWCGPCIEAIPQMKELEERYGEQGVLFFGVHTAGTDMSLIKDLLKRQNWKAVTGLDRGDSAASGATVRSYGVRGFPSVVIIDRQGRIAFHSGDVRAVEQFKKEMEVLARSMNLRWPPEEGADREQIAQAMRRLLVAFYGRQIERALNAEAQ